MAKHRVVWKKLSFCPEFLTTFCIFFLDTKCFIWQLLYQIRIIVSNNIVLLVFIFFIMNQVFNIHCALSHDPPNLYDFIYIVSFCKWRNQSPAKKNYFLKVISLVNVKTRNKALFFLLLDGISQIVLLNFYCEVVNSFLEWEVIPWMNELNEWMNEWVKERKETQKFIFPGQVLFAEKRSDIILFCLV